MATRLHRKNTIATSKEVVPTEKPIAKNEPIVTVVPNPMTKPAIGKRIARKNQTKRVNKTSVAVKLKAKAKKFPLLQNAKTAEGKKRLLKNAKPRTRKVREETDESPPVLEPIFPLEENVESKKQPRTRATKKTVGELQDTTKVKVENEEDVSLSSDVSNSEIPTLTRQVRKPRAPKRPKPESETLEDVMNDLSFLIKTEEAKEEGESLSESSKSENMSKPKKLTKRQRIELLKKKIIKKENIENTLSKLDSADEKVIDMLDLNVKRVKQKPISNRRHSIEKFPVGPSEESETPLPFLGNFPRSFSPKTRKIVKPRQSIEGLKRTSPYTTRSDTPAKTLRNGKQRKAKGQLLEGLETDVKKRRRLCSDISEMSMSKLSGYDSDSSFSDLSSVHGAEINETEVLKTKEESSRPAADSETTNTASGGPMDNSRIIDTNSNFHVGGDKEEEDSSLPDKDTLLDIMKQAFNNVKTAQQEVDVMEASKFYGKQTKDAADQSLDQELNTISHQPETTQNVDDDLGVQDQNNTTEEQSNSVDMEEDHPEDKCSTTEETKTNTLEDDSFATSDTMTNDSEVVAQSCDEMAELPKLEEEPEPMQIDEECLGVEPEKVELVEDPQAGETKKLVEKLEDVSECDTTDEIVPDDKEDVKVEDSNEMPNSLRGAGEASGMEVTEALDAESKASSEASGSHPVDNNINVTDNSCAVMENSEANVNVNIEESAEELAVKENMFMALGLRSMKAVEEEAKHKTLRDRPSCSGWKNDSYTGTLKTVIKINRDKKKGGKSSMKATLKTKPKPAVAEGEQNVGEEQNKVNKDAIPSTSKQGSHSSDTAGAHRKSHYSNRSNLDGSSEHTSDGETGTQDGAIKALVIPEKASSFSIHPGRLCKDECSYCFGKFGLFDTPCHIAQMKSVERQNKILDTEKHLTRDSCLCDACYRHVDRKSNTPSYTNKSFKRNSMVAPGPRQNHCHVLGCGMVAANILRRKWIIKMRKSICQVINIDLDNPGLHSIPICESHYSALEHLMICAMCKRRLARNHIHYLGPEVDDLNAVLDAEGVPLSLNDKPVVCKLCKCFASIILKGAEERPESSENFFREYKKRLLHFNHIVPMDSAAAEEPIVVPSKADRSDSWNKKKKSRKSDVERPESRESAEKTDEKGSNSGSQSRADSPSDEYNGVDYNTLIPTIAMDCGSDTESKKDPAAFLKKFGSQFEAIKDSIEITKVPKHSKIKNPVVEKLGANPCLSVRQLFPGEEDVPLTAHIDFDNVREVTPEGWEKCSSTIQYDSETQRLWEELQKPYGNQSSFLRHLILLEKYFRNGDLVLSPRAGHHAINYSESVNNRLRAYDNMTSGVSNVQPLSMLPFNKMQKSNSGIITSAHVVTATSTSPPPSITCKPIGNVAMSVTTIPSLAQQGVTLLPNPAHYKAGVPVFPAAPAQSVTAVKPRAATTAPPPGLISLHASGGRPLAPSTTGLVKAPQSQKIKFPITKNWRPNLIPIDPNKKQEKRVGLVQVISGGKPYHITLEDYKKMCAIKRSFEMKQKRLQETQAAKPILVTHNSVLKSIIPRKGLIISKTATVKTEAPSPSAHSEENILEKLDKQVEKLESKLNEKGGASLLLPRIPRSLTVIPQTVTRKTASRPPSPVLLITQKTNGNKS